MSHPGLDFDANRLRNVIRSMLKCVEGDNADWITKLASQKIRPAFRVFDAADVHFEHRLIFVERVSQSGGLHA